MIIWILENTREYQFKTSVNIRAVLGSTRRYQTVSDVFLQNMCEMCVWLGFSNNIFGKTYELNFKYDSSLSSKEPQLSSNSLEKLQ